MSNSASLQEMFGGTADDQEIADLAGLIGQSRSTLAKRQAQQEAAHQASLASAIAHAHSLADAARADLLKEIKKQLVDTEPNLVRCRVDIPDFANADFRDRKTLQREFRDHLTAPLMGVLYSKKESNPTSVNFGHLVFTISARAGM